jgi:hypothetical protein
VLVAEDAAFFEHDGVDYDELKESIEIQLGTRPVPARRVDDHSATGEEPVSFTVAESVSEDP